MAESESHVDGAGSRPADERLGDEVPDLLAYYKDVYRYAFRLAGSHPEAEDLAQQAFLQACRNSHQLKEPTKTKSWLFAILRSCFLKGLRKRTPLTGIDLAVDAIPDPAATETTVDEEGLQTAIAALPNEYRLVVLMFYFEDLSYKQIAAELGIPAGTVMSRLSRAKTRLRRHLGESGETTANECFPRNDT